MARDPNQQFIYNDQELELIKNTFAENDTLLYTVRKVLLQFPLTDTEKGLLKMSITPEVWRVLQKRILPEISDEFPLGQLPTLLSTLTEQLKVRTIEEMAPLFASKKLQLDYLTQQFEVLRDLDAPQPIVLADLGVIAKDPTDAYVAAHAYLFLLGYIDPMLGFIKAIAGEKKETLEKTKERLTRNSSK